MLEKIEIEYDLDKEEIFSFLSDKKRERILELAEEFKDKKIVQINSTPVGGGVAELLQSLIPYLQALGVSAEWYVIQPYFGEEFFAMTNKIHNGLQGEPVTFGDEEWEMYEKENREAAKDIAELDADVLVINDYQALLAGYLQKNVKKIYYSHVDTTSPHEPIWKKLKSWIQGFDMYIFSSEDFVKGDLDQSKVEIFTPAIDPFRLKQRIVPTKKAKKYISDYGVPEDAELLVQVSRFDVWKGPFGVVKAFQKMKSLRPNAHLLMVGLSEARDNPESERVYNQVKELVGDDNRIHLFYDPKEHGIDNISKFTMYVQNAADVVVQNSKREGFGLVVSEAMWKGKPVLGGTASGVRRQVKDGWNGYLVETEVELAERMAEVLEDSEKREEMGKNAREYVREHFIFSRLVLDHLSAYSDLIQ